jgi:hypothetical protein
VEDLPIVLHPRGDISQYLEMRAKLVSASPFVLLSCLDSSRDPASLITIRKLLENTNGSYEVDGQAVFPGGKIVELAVSRFFNGFDEMWICNSKPTSGLPDRASLVGPLTPNISISMAP